MTNTHLNTTHVLLLGGVTEAYALAEQLTAREGFHSISSLAGRTAAPRTPVGENRIGGFGGAAGLREFLHARAIRAVVDATHPFASTMGEHAAQACQQAGVPLLRLERPIWEPTAEDRWWSVADWDQASVQLQTRGARRVLLALGVRELDAFTRLEHIWFLLRTVTPPNPMPPFAAAKVLIERGPFTLESERELLRSYAIDTIVCRNSGGEGALAKLLAARELGIDVIMRERPPRPPLPTVSTVDAAMRWLEQYAGS
ncbi:cobalt-precorrin-6A reductase [Rhabdochromatium marinum]|uniref:cobalt-precorrin-6A reductase n=1 Tax=Rhabdochromatium marinum TaxID=48729 RepID=UPI001902F907|nr:cobalt-precorrin-6A reductase [Rhabdochromatium marinum]MBK1648635.1 cobalt-precorrin-6A reductase [Rhabdochromatium marinum]